MFDIRKVFRLSAGIRSWVERQQAEDIELEEVLAAAQEVIENNDQDVELRCWAAACAVVVVAMINEEREADGCDADTG